MMEEMMEEMIEGIEEKMMDRTDVWVSFCTRYIYVRYICRKYNLAASSYMAS
jgi:hypothetical protein